MAISGVKASRVRTGQRTTLSRVAAAYLWILALLFCVQVGLGARFDLLLELTAVGAVAAIPLSSRNKSPEDFFLMGLSFYYGTFALILKSIATQPVQQNLIAPVASGVLLIVSFLLMASTRYIVTLLPDLRLAQPITETASDMNFLRIAARPVLILGIAFFSLNLYYGSSVQDIEHGVGDEGFGGFGSFYPILLLGLTLQLALMLTMGRVQDKILTVLAFAVIIGLALINNQKRVVFDCALVLIICCIGLRVKVRPATLVGAGVGVLVLMLYFAPVVQIVRAQNVGKSQRLAATLSVLQEANFNPLTLNEMQDKALSGYASYLRSYFYPKAWNADRYTFVSSIDAVIGNAGKISPVGVNVYATRLATSILPSVLVKKDDLAMADLVGWRYGVSDIRSVARPALGYIATGYGVSGLAGALVYPFLCCLAVFLALRLFGGGGVLMNPWAIFMASYNFVLAEGDVSVYLTLLRAFAIAVIFGLAMVYAYRLLGSLRTAPA